MPGDSWFYPSFPEKSEYCCWSFLNLNLSLWWDPLDPFIKPRIFHGYWRIPILGPWPMNLSHGQSLSLWILCFDAPPSLCFGFPDPRCKSKQVWDGSASSLGPWPLVKGSAVILCDIWNGGNMFSFFSSLSQRFEKNHACPSFSQWSKSVVCWLWQILRMRRKLIKCLFFSIPLWACTVFKPILRAKSPSWPWISPRTVCLGPRYIQKDTFLEDENDSPFNFVPKYDIAG